MYMYINLVYVKLAEQNSDWNFISTHKVDIIGISAIFLFQCGKHFS